MGDIKLFRIDANGVQELAGQSVQLEKSLQTQIETHLESFLGVRFLASEYSTGKSYGGRIDTLGLDENGFPVIIEYKRARNENVINQGLFYLDWLMDHRAEFQLLVQKIYGADVAESIDWSNPRLLCIAGDYTKYDQYAVAQINRNIELLRYRRYGNELMLLELVNATSVQATGGEWGSSTSTGESTRSSHSNGGSSRTTVTDSLERAPTALQDLYHELEAHIEALGDDVQKKTLKNYFAFKRLKNFACVVVHSSANRLLIYLKVDPDSIEFDPDMMRDVRDIGTFGTGDLELNVANQAQLERAKPLIEASYEVS